MLFFLDTSPLYESIPTTSQFGRGQEVDVVDDNSYVRMELTSDNWLSVRTKMYALMQNGDHSVDDGSCLGGNRSS